MLLVYVWLGISAVLQPLHEPPVLHTAELLPRRLSLPQLLILRGGEHNYYEVLGVQSNATHAELKRAYRRRSLELHPDRNRDPGAHDAFIELGQAYETLRDPGKRRQYDQQRQWRQRHGGQQRERRKDRQWKPPPRSEPMEPYSMEDALQTFRSFWGHAVELVGEKQLDAILNADSPFAFAAKSSWVSTGIAFLLSGPNVTAAQREERRRMIDAALGMAAPLLASTIGRQKVARILGNLALMTLPLALFKLVGSWLPGWAIGTALAGSATIGLLRLAKVSKSERIALWRRADEAVDAAVNALAAIAGISRAKAKRILTSTALVLGPLALYSTLVLAAGIRHPLRRIPALLRRWVLGAAAIAALRTAWGVLIARAGADDGAFEGEGDARGDAG